MSESNGCSWSICLRFDVLALFLWVRYCSLVYEAPSGRREDEEIKPRYSAIRRIVAMDVYLPIYLCGDLLVPANLRGATTTEF